MKKANKIENLAVDFLIDNKVDTLPQNALKLAFDNDMLLDNYTQLSAYLTQQHNEVITVNDLVNEYGNALVIASVKYKRYAIIYNNTSPSSSINWAVAHELGHIMLKHVSIDNDTINYMAEYGTAPIEAEAEAYAGYLLAPDIILSLFNIATPDAISTTCYIPYDKAIRKSQELGFKSNKRKLFNSTK